MLDALAGVFGYVDENAFVVMTEHDSYFLTKWPEKDVAV